MRRLSLVPLLAFALTALVLTGPVRAQARPTAGSAVAEKGAADAWSHLRVTLGNVTGFQTSDQPGWRNNGTGFSANAAGAGPVPIQIEITGKGSVSYFDYTVGVSVRTSGDAPELLHQDAVISKDGGSLSYSCTWDPRTSPGGVSVRVSISGGNPEYFTYFVSGRIDPAPTPAPGAAPPPVRPPDRKGNLNLELKALSGMGDEMFIGQAKCTFLDPSTGQTRTLTTDSGGHAKCGVDVADAGAGATVQIQQVTLARASEFASILGRAPSYLGDRNPLVIDVNQIVTLTEANNFTATFSYTLPVRQVFLTLRRFALTPQPVSAPVNVSQESPTGPLLFRIPAWTGENSPTFYVPAREVLGWDQLSFSASVTIGTLSYEGFADVPAPGRPDRSLAVLLELDSGDMDRQFDKYRARLREFLSQAGYTEEQLRRIMAVRFVANPNLGGNWVSNTTEVGGHIFSQTILYPGSARFATSTETALHEFGHAVMSIVATDSPDGVGTPHEGSEPTNLNLAYDEGRAHMLSALLTRELGLPPARVHEGTGAPAGDAVLREYFVRDGLFDFYSDRTVFATPQQALNDMTQMDDLARQQLGRPVRTIREFLALQRAAGRSEPARLQAVERVSQRYGFQ